MIVKKCLLLSTASDVLNFRRAEDSPKERKTFVVLLNKKYLIETEKKCPAVMYSSMI